MFLFLLYLNEMDTRYARLIDGKLYKLHVKHVQNFFFIFVNNNSNFVI